MKVKELITRLSKMDQTAEVIISSDEEGNSYGSIDRKSIIPGYFENIEESSEALQKTIVIFPYESTDEPESLV
jgi:uncharacterized lipoprotein